MPPKVAKVDLRPFPKRDENFTINARVQYGKGDNPPLYGQKVIPVGKPNCLLGNTFVPTGNTLQKVDFPQIDTSSIVASFLVEP